MKTKFSVKNFRVFDDQGAEFEIAPITILTGTNSAGKSSLAKALLCVREVLQCMDVTSTSVDMLEQNIDFQANGKSLGQFKDVVCNHSNEKEKISFSYTMDILNETYTIECTLIQKKEDKQFLDRGWIDSISILDSEKKICYDIFNTKLCVNFFSENLYSNFLSVLDVMELSYKKDITIATSSDYAFAIDKEKYEKLLERARDAEKEYKNLLSKKGLLKYEGLIEKIFKRSSTIIAPFIDCNNQFEKLIADEKNAFDQWNEVGAISRIKQFLDNRKMFYLPIFDELKGKSKYETISFLQTRLNEIQIHEDNTNFRNLIEQLLNVFEASEYQSLEDFYYNYSKEIVGCYFTIPNDKNYLHSPSRSYNDLDFFMKSNKSNAESLKWRKKNDTEFVDGYEFDVTDCSVENFLCTSDEDNQSLSYDIDWEFVDDFVKMQALLAKCSYEKVQPESIYSFALYRMFIEKVVQICLRPIFMDNIHYLGTDKINVLRSYSLDSSQKQFASILRKYNDNLISHNTDEKAENGAYGHGKFLHKWLRKLGIARNLMLKVNSETSDISVFLGKLDSRKLRNLADEGCGITQIVALLIQIENTIADCVISKGEMEPTLIVEEPEIHIHPKYQSLLADMFLEAYKTYGIHFIVETHSEYLIRKFQVLTAMKEVSSEDLSVYYLYDANPHKRPKNEKQVKKIEFQENGYLKEPFGLGFFDESRSLVFELLKLSQISKN